VSYILDALKKSEAQRRQQEGLAADAALNQQSTAKISNRGIFLLLGVALLVVALLLWNLLTLTADSDVGEYHRVTEAEQSQPASTSTSADGRKVNVPAAPEHEVANTEQTHELDIAPVPVKVASVPVAPAVTPSTETARTDQKVKQVGSDSTQSALNDPAVQRAMPPISALRRIPQLMINSHIYSPVADKRSVIMNNREWHEGDFVAEGVYLKEITSDGITLDVEGWPVHVGRSKGWQAIPGSD
tara:strand:- start:759 stop:1490 length:732 start_codon:yes stop_codon:yes gene_type:complete